MSNPNLIGGGRLTRAEVSSLKGDHRKLDNQKVSKSALLKRLWQYLGRNRMLLVLSLIIWRPFCKYLCPLGAIYGLFNRFSLYRNSLDRDKCVSCGACAAACRMCVDPAETPNHSECIRCGDCVRVCPTGAIKCGFGEKK